MFSGIPLPQTVANNEPGGGIITAYNALSGAKSKAAEAKYSPYQAYANALLTQQQAKSQFINQLANPLLWATQGGREGATALLNSLTSPNGPGLTGMAGQGNVNIPSPNGDGGGSFDSNSLMGMVINKIKSLGRGGNNALTGTNSNNGTNSQNTNNLMTPPSANGMPTGGNVSPGATTPASQITSQASGSGNGFQGGVNPVTAAEAGAGALKTAASGQQANENAQLNESQKRAVNGGRMGTLLSNYADAFHSQYPKAHYTGARFGNLPKEGLEAAPTWPGQDLSHDQLLNTYSDNMIAALGPTLQTGTGHITDSLFDLASRLKLHASLEPEAENDVYHSIKSTSTRMKQETPFLNQIYKNNPGIQDSEAQALYNAYNYELPPYDFNTLEPRPENNKRWKEFTTPQALQEYRDTGEFIPKDLKENNGTPEENPYINSKAKKNIPNEGKPVTINGRTWELGAPTDADIKATAKKYKMTVQEVKKYLGLNNAAA